MSKITKEITAFRRELHDAYQTVLTITTDSTSPQGTLDFSSTETRISLSLPLETLSGLADFISEISSDPAVLEIITRLGTEPESV